MRAAADGARRVMALLGMARAGGNVVLGEKACLKGIERGAVAILIVADDAGRSTEKRFRRRCDEAGVKLVAWGSKGGLGHAVGASPKAVVGVTEHGLARAIGTAIESVSGADCGG